ncbi:polysaccharide lyase family 8 super-sandwich domain-containing protein [Chitinophaga cymbidii]|uniref:Chondroitinase n=1 Tax=Chitinophaga cymbidii TaxID=1096750 RepID=A0A512RLQ4_9BACT|nr:polysaccharide lyase family 8 super-sandwich domain-containing protein [Chitinophaga cymbidii]GEP96599.1 chondroitinase [Chitinophaga cymbidii]
MRIATLLCLQFFLLLSAHGQADTLLNRYKAYLLRTEPLLETSWAATLNANGQWPDINYENKDLAGWKISSHLVRIRQMALDWAHPASPSYHDQKLWRQINSALDHWLQHRYQSANWWHNEIGVPRQMRDIILLLRDQLSPDRLRLSLEILDQFLIREDFVGGNLIWCADLGMHYGALTGDEALIKRCRDWMVKEIAITTGEGVQPDYSFHQHGKRLQMYQYGKAFVTESMRIAWQCRGTAWAFPDPQLDVLADFVLKGWQWMARGIYTVPGTMDRSASRKGELKSADLRTLIPFMMELRPDKAAAFREMEKVENGKAQLTGFRYYPYSDFAAFHRPGFSFFLKTISARTYTTESINKENLKGKLLHSGDAYLIRNGNEYTDLLPLWDWTALPGVTMFKGAHQIERKPFVGSAGDERSGLSAMDYVLKDSTATQTLSSRKFWACHHDVVIALIADLQGKDAWTALDQCRWQGDVTVNRPGNVLKAGRHAFLHLKWIHHAGFAYIPLQPVSFNIRLEKVTGNWTTINASETPQQLTEKIFTPVMIHDRPATGYALALCETPAQAAALADHPAWKVLRNDRDCQAVRFDDGALMIAFYAAGAVKGYVEADQPCLVMLKDGMLYASDPTHKGITVNIKTGHETFRLTLPADGTTIVRK